jgi:hypothetical protein
MTTAPYSVDYWYRHESDDDRSVRTHCQMSASANSECDVRAEIAALQGSGYTVQKAVMRLTCVACGGAGRIGKAPKGTRKTKAASLPAWRLKWSNCVVCRGDGYVDSTTIDLG